MTHLDAFVAREGSRILNELIDFLRIPSVSTDPARDGDCRRAALWLAEHLRGLGCAEVQLLGSDTHPVVHGEGPPVTGRPTVLIYGHYDVQPAGPLEAWLSPPFGPEVRGGNLYARGATDDKGQLFALVKAVEAAFRSGGPGVNVRFLVEGQEESGGEVLIALARERPELMRADVVLVADGPWYAPGWPSAEVAVRGICYAEIDVRTLAEDRHSGLYGGVAPNAHEALVRILTALKSPQGRIRVPGLYQRVVRPPRRERDSWKALPLDLDAFTRDEVGAAALAGDPRRTVHERLWALPTLDIHGITGGFTGEGAMTVIPAWARAKISLRLVPDQRADEVLGQLAAAVRAAAPDHVRVEVRPLNLADPVLVDVAHPAFCHLDRAFREVEGRGLSLTRSGGSLPILGELARGGGAVLVAGLGLPDDNMHAPNEKLSVQQFLKGVRVFGRLLGDLADDTIINGGSGQ
jgi:acetylornithine deacetylase/succinyl-diaminopimelate desuccinylase-like protein